MLMQLMNGQICWRSRAAGAVFGQRIGHDLSRVRSGGRRIV